MDGQSPRVLKKHFSGLIAALILFIFSMIPIVIQGQEKKVSHANQLWLQYYSQIALTNKWSLLVDGGHRWQDVFQERTQYIIRMAAGYNLNPDMRVAAGVGHFGAYHTSDLSRIELRPYQELVLKNRLNKVSLSHRYRIEERFFYPVLDGEVQTPHSFNFRFRYAITVSIPIVKWPKESGERAILMNVGDEVFINAGKDIGHNIFNQNRVLISPSLKMNEQLTFSFTWNYQFASTSTPEDFAVTNVVWLQVKQRFK